MNFSDLFSGIPESPWFYLFAFASMLFFGISKGGFAGNFGVVALPLMAVVLPVERSVSVMLPVLCFMDLIGLRLYKGIYDKKNLLLLTPPMLLGVFIGSLTFGSLPGKIIGALIGFMALFYLAYTFLQKILKKAKQNNFQHILPKAGFYGLLLGFSSTIAHAGGIPAQMYLLPQKLDKKIFVGTTVILFAAANFAKLIPYTILGFFSLQNLFISLCLLPVAPVGMYLGKYLQDKISEVFFYRLCVTLLFATSLKLIFDGFKPSF